MTPDDPRHGTVAGYHGQGCRCVPCTRASTRYAKERVMLEDRGQPRLVPILGFIRRVQALRRFGWSTDAIAAEMGISRGTLSTKITYHKFIRVDTLAQMNRVYEKLSMIPGPSSSSRKRAEAKGWPPPFAWTDIDDPNEQPDLGTDNPDTLDEVLIQRAMNGETVNATKAERLEIIRRWKAAGRTLNDLERIQPWNVRRELRKAA